MPFRKIAISLASGVSVLLLLPSLTLITEFYTEFIEKSYYFHINIGNADSFNCMALGHIKCKRVGWNECHFK